MTKPKLRTAKNTYLVIDRLGQPQDCPGASSLTKMLYAPALENWKIRRCVDHYRRTKNYEEALKAHRGSSPESEFGDHVHEATELLDAGETLDDYSINIRSTAQGWETLKQKHDIEVLHSETTVANQQHLYAGTLDRLVTVDGGPPAILDIKTSKAIYPDVQVQLAALAHSQGFLKSDGLIDKWDTPPSHQIAYIAHLPKQGDPALIPISFNHGAFDAVTSLARLWHWNRYNQLAIGEPL